MQRDPLRPQLAGDLLQREAGERQQRGNGQRRRRPVRRDPQRQRGRLRDHRSRPAERIEQRALGVDAGQQGEPCGDVFAQRCRPLPPGPARVQAVSAQVDPGRRTTALQPEVDQDPRAARIDGRAREPARGEAIADRVLDQPRGVERRPQFLRGAGHAHRPRQLARQPLLPRDPGQLGLEPFRLAGERLGQLQDDPRRRAHPERQPRPQQQVAGDAHRPARRRQRLGPAETADLGRGRRLEAGGHGEAIDEGGRRNAQASAARALPTSSVKACGWVNARSASTRRSSSIPARLRPFIRRL